MNNIEEILTGSLRPYVTDTRGNDYYEPEYLALDEIPAAFINHYNIAFDLPKFTSKIKYYCRLIDNAIISKLNNDFYEMTRASNPRVAYRYKKATEDLRKNLRVIKSIIESNGFELSQLESDHIDYKVDVAHKESTYILNYLMVSLMYQHLEFQAHFKDEIDPLKQMNITSYYVEILGVNPPRNTRIHEIENIPTIPVKEHKKPVENKALKTYTIMLGKDAQSSFLVALHVALEKAGVINCGYSDFKRLFSCVKFDKKHKWLNSNGSLRYFIMQLDEKGIISYPTNKKWEIVSNFFLSKQGFLLTGKQLKDSKTSTNDKKLIDPVIQAAFDALK